MLFYKEVGLYNCKKWAIMPNRHYKSDHKNIGGWAKRSNLLHKSFL